ncbi:MAG: response regulator [Gomphosphaeria aponina SAG 52.96 = DSM 107014]|uniref:histidine kinase n=1 Tax=Gomphosphaeria aponina SAG 52.96 = DSM 107014 TaxID=1521640 RepID=A0A941JVJ9_9CHRO|nr:response regulator [Gomphosphaeria aponina SAG 52.96 = DSM 107014]
MTEPYSLPPKADILVVDDTPENLRLLMGILAKQGYKVRPTTNGKNALAVARRESPDLILLDILMPEMDGYSVCKELKADPNFTNIPVIFISALNEPIDKVQAFAVGGVDYISKPFQLEEVVARVENQLRIQSLQKQLQEKNSLLEQINLKLKHSNNALEEFAHVVSHDLQQPLQCIIGYTQILEYQQQNILNQEAKSYLNKILESGMWMQSFINDLLNHASLESLGGYLTPIDCNQVLKQALNNLQIAIDEQKAQVTSDSLPIVMGNQTLLIQLLQNLLSNALKFSRPEVPLEIKILVEEKEGEWLFKIQDNGIGIKPKNFERIFQVFQRLEQETKTSGTGIGLATCKKIVELHGGRIWVESQMGLGTVFYFTIPASVIQ